MEDALLRTEGLFAYYGENAILKNVNLTILRNTATAIMGPSGCGKTTLIRCINRMHELTPGTKIEGRVLLDGNNIYEMEPIVVRRRTGMVFQRPNPFPTMVIYDNVIAGYKLNGIKLGRAEKDRIVEESLRKAALWDEVKDFLFKRGTHLSGGQQQRLCIARALAMQPEILLLDEPTSSLDPKSTSFIEELIAELKKEVTIALVTHNMQQAARISDMTAFLMLGELIEFEKTSDIFTRPKNKLTEEYVTGRFG